MQRLFLSSLLGLLPLLAAASGPVRTDQVTAELVSESAGIQPGTSFWVGLKLDHEPHWHTYWQNPGDSGLATSLTWDLPDGFTADPVIWPIPEFIPLEPLVSYGFEGTTLLMVRLTPPDDLPVGQSVDLRVRADWLACQEVCIPGGADLDLTLPVVADGPVLNPDQADLFALTRAELPLEGVGWPVTLSGAGEKLQLDVRLPEGSVVNPQDVFFFNRDESVIEPGALQEVTFEDGLLSLRLTPAIYADGPVDAVNGILFAGSGFGPTVPGNGVILSAAIGSSGAATELSVIGRTAPQETTKEAIGLFRALILAFVGGLILNLMPCVFPVLSIKILSFVQQAGEDRGRILRHGLVFALGVLVSFWALAGTLIALRAGGALLGWGFQLQSPLFIVLIAAVLFMLSLSLAGVFEVGGSLIGVGAGKGSSGYSGSFFTGVLATVVATPCTAPFMGAALAFALSQPAVVSLIVFTVLGLGMSAPYVLLSAVPSLLRLMPRPGAWMETFKQLMAFPLLATVIWLTWVLGQQVNIDGITWFLFGLLLLGIACWIYGRWTTPIRSSVVRLVARAIALAVVVFGLYVASAGVRSPVTAVIPAGEVAPGEIGWVTYDREKLMELRAAGTPVFLDFTAAWCLTCKANELVVFRSQEVRDSFAERGIVPMKADWTSRNPEITQALAEYGRTGVPLYVYFAGDGSDPLILPEILKPGIVLDAIRGN